MMDALIPFAIKADTGEYVSVDDVESGERCGCICPGCNAPLVARKGEINQHHFGHMPKSIDPDQPCPINFKRSLLWMSDALVRHAEHLTLPGLEYQLTAPEGHDIITATTERVVQHSYQSVHWNDMGDYLEVSVEVKGVPIQLLLSVDKTAPRVNPDGKEAIIFFNLFEASQKIRNAKQGFAAILKAAVTESTENKVWVSHPRLHRLVKAKRDEHKARRDRDPEALEAEKKHRHTESLRRDEQETERAETMVRIARKIAASGNSGRQCTKCYMMTPYKAYFRRCPYCGNLGFGTVSLTPEYLKKAKHMYLSFGYARDSLKYSTLTAE